MESALKKTEKLSNGHCCQGCEAVNLAGIAGCRVVGTGILENIPVIPSQVKCWTSLAPQVFAGYIFKRKFSYMYLKG